MTTAPGNCRCLKDSVSRWNSYGWAISKLSQGHLTFSVPRRSALFQMPSSMMTFVTAQRRVLMKPSTPVTLVVLICHPFHKKQMLVTAGRLAKVLLPPFKIQNPKRIIVFAYIWVPGCSLHVTPNEIKIMDSFHTWFLQLHLSSFASTASKDVCPDLRCLDIVTGLIDRPRCVGLGSAVDPFLCPPVDDSNTPCTIDRSLVDNNQCDCPGTCADESSWTCQNCSCVTWYIASKFSMVLLYFAVPFSYSSGGQAGKWATTEITWGCYMASLLFLILIKFTVYFCDLLCLFPIETWNFRKGELLWSSALWVQGWWWNYPMPRDARFQLQPSSESSKQRSVRLSRDLCGWGPNPKLWRTGFSSELRGLPMSWGMWTVLVFLVKYCASQLQLPATSGSWNLCLWAILGTTATFSMSTTWRMLVATVLCEWQCLRLSRNMCRWGWLELRYLHLSGSVWDKESQLFWFAFSLPRQLLYNQHFPRQRRELWLPHLCWWGSFYLWNLQCRMSHWTELQQFARISMRSSSFFCPLTSDGTICSPFPASYVNDNVCDCPDCSDEQNWDCSNCSAGCTECRPWGPLSEYQVVRSQNTQRLVNCFGDALAPEFEVRCPGYPAQTPLPATPLGCSISFSSVNDNKCDCPTCRDEALEDCDDEICSSSNFCSPGGVNSLVCPCPSECGMPTDCTGKCIADPNPFLFILRDKPIPTIPPECLYFCPSGASCAKHVQVLNNSVCDCLDCEDEADWSCETCQCPSTEPGYLDFPKVGCDFTPLDVVLQGKGDLDTVLNTKLAGTCSYPPPPGPIPLALTKGTLTKKMLERRDRKPTQSQQESAQWEELLNSALADDHIRKAMESATAQGSTRRSQEAGSLGIILPKLMSSRCKRVLFVGAWIVYIQSICIYSPSIRFNWIGYGVAFVSLCGPNWDT